MSFKPQTPYQPYASVHQETKGPGDDRPTALQIIKDCNAAGTLKGKTILITGTSSGIGVETARALYETGAQLFLTARDIPKLEKVIEDIVSNSSAKDVPRPQAIEIHLDSLASVRDGAEDFKKRSNGQLNMLICNAGVMACPQAKTQDDLELQIGTSQCYFVDLIP
jgi:NAD(P)-dependent dehydrogenase (short-subunit alcohol dehydrogenase family)